MSPMILKILDPVGGALNSGNMLSALKKQRKRNPPLSSSVPGRLSCSNVNNFVFNWKGLVEFGINANTGSIFKYDQ